VVQVSNGKIGEEEDRNLSGEKQLDLSMGICEFTSSDRANFSIQTFLESDEQAKLLAGSNIHERVRIQTRTGTVVADQGDVARVLEAAAGLH
jgi:hypothetical protein